MPDFQDFDWQPGTELSQANLNEYVRDNLTVLKVPSRNRVTTVTIQDVTSTSFVDLTAMTMTITPQIASGTTILEFFGAISVRCSANATLYSVALDLVVGGVSVSGGVGIALARGNADQTFMLPISWVAEGVTPGVKTVKLQALTTSGATSRFHIGSALNHFHVIER